MYNESSNFSHEPSDRLWKLAGFDDSSRRTSIATSGSDYFPSEFISDNSPTLADVRRSFEDLPYRSSVGSQNNSLDTLLVQATSNGGKSDSEIAAILGFKLMKQKRDLEALLVDTKVQLSQSEDMVNQLKHNLKQKDDLLQSYIRDMAPESDRSIIGGDDGGWTSPELIHGRPDQSSTPLLRVGSKLAADRTYPSEEKSSSARLEHSTPPPVDTGLTRDYARQLIRANECIRELSVELSKKTDSLMSRQNDVNRLVSCVPELENRLRQMSVENELLLDRLNHSQLSQQQFVHELMTLRDRYDECCSLYAQSKDQERKLRKRCRNSMLFVSPNSINSNQPPSVSPSMFSDAVLELCDDMSSSDHELGPSAFPDISNSQFGSPVPRMLSVQVPSYTEHLEDYSGDTCSNPDPSKNVSFNPLEPEFRVTPRHHRSESAHARMKRHSWVSPESSSATLRTNSNCKQNDSCDDSVSHADCSSHMFSQSSSRQSKRIQLIKSMQGSSILKQWQDLATPSLTKALFDAPLPSITNRAAPTTTPPSSIDDTWLENYAKAQDDYSPGSDEDNPRFHPLHKCTSAPLHDSSFRSSKKWPGSGNRPKYTNPYPLSADEPDSPSFLNTLSNLISSWFISDSKKNLLANQSSSSKIKPAPRAYSRGLLDIQGIIPADATDPLVVEPGTKLPTPMAPSRAVPFSQAAPPPTRTAHRASLEGINEESLSDNSSSAPSSVD